MAKIGIAGASGYTGFELLRLLTNHPDAEIVFLTSETYQGEDISKVFPSISGFVDTKLSSIESASSDTCDIVFLALPHATSMEKVPDFLKGGTKVIDLSADYRLKDPAVFKEWYSVPHQQPALLKDAVYGLPEIHREKIKPARLVANPGCYPTSFLLPTWPLIIKNIFDNNRPIIVDSKSGVSGAGRSPKQHLHFVEVSGNFQPYKIGRVHRHVPEMEQQLLSWNSRFQELIFTPHLLPVPRGILSTIYLPVKPGTKEDDIRAICSKTYANEPFVKLLPSSQNASLAHVLHSNLCVFGLNLTGNTLIITSAIDNLVKGAAGQAVQNMNIVYGITETCGLE